ncbi:hypothetical protein K504DRAFT_488107 [Pleomassaria siparia CBS 279.74]|uniref:Uncharacterized protein n=1 Tax=Pleomassaria siparia CBS 279.74 TaxID=1314801 RepID=A0A6G1KMK7_9PLEO|nr:hypothetical protein K504DRAFT_488107 [Pleomassaria siparia CBS 279.74]
MKITMLKALAIFAGLLPFARPYPEGPQQSPSIMGKLPHAETRVGEGSTITDRLQAEIAHGPLKKRWPYSPIGDADWAKMSCRGTKLIDMMDKEDAAAGQLLNPPQSSAASVWRDFPGDLSNWGWTPSAALHNRLCDMDKPQYGLKPTIEGLGIPITSAWLKCYTTQHGLQSGRDPVNLQTYTTRDGRTLRSTGGNFAFIIDPSQGLLIITKQYSPENEASQRSPPVTELPELRRSSDVTFGQWAMVAQQNIQHIKFIGIWAITNIQSATTIARALENVGKTLEAWPGTDFAMATAEFKAILGTPSGTGIAYFLAQHKAQLGKKRIYSVRVFNHESRMKGKDACLMFYIQDI